ncbi:chemotaxis protein CheB [Mesorhizobium sp. WSM4313]|uniref:chemotaxis protein CheB n=1 Tax=Mesorhizobium sp. WSM4313 TaxID=2029412 RepID=UPI000BAF4428|nr:chemotaxis protein CheB [Mesorhizobium sp. WSM4313]PBB17853.1 hypothetical protein CK219_22120 [Mesorhizobium sp. WSM4313]
MARPKGLSNHHNIIVMGASAGGIEPLKQIVANLPVDLPAAIFVVLHICHRLRQRHRLPDRFRDKPKLSKPVDYNLLIEAVSRFRKSDAPD